MKISKQWKTLRKRKLLPDRLRVIRAGWEKGLRSVLPGLTGILEIDQVGHWVQHEASNQVSEQLVKFLRTVSPA